VAATPTGPARALNIEFVTVRPAGAITVDGRRAMEREFAPISGSCSARTRKTAPAMPARSG
jgi:hypothetical protein